MSQLAFSPRLPDGFYIPELSTADSALGDRTFVEIPAEGNTIFRQGGRTTIEFKATNNKAFMDTANSYIRGQLICGVSRADISGEITEAANPAIPDRYKTAYIAEGGIHAFIQTVEILTANNTLLERIDNYNKFYSIMSTASHPRDYVDCVGSRELDSVGYGSLRRLTGTIGIAVSGTPDKFGAVTGSSTVFLSQLRLGDLISLNTDLLSAPVYKVVEISSDTAAKIVRIDGANFTTAVSSSSVAYACTEDDQVQPARWRAAKGDLVQFGFQPLSGFLESPEVKALPFMAGGGFIIRLTLDFPWKALAIAEDLNTKCVPYFEIRNPMLVANMVNPREDLMAEWREAYEEGRITYSFVSPFYSNSNDSSGQGSPNVITINSALRSVKGFVARIQDSRANQESAADALIGVSSHFVDSIAQGKKAGLSSFMINAGGQYYFPLSQPLDTTNVMNSELLGHLQNMLGALGNTIQQTRFKNSDWSSVYSMKDAYQRGVSIGNSEPQRLILGCLLSKDPSPMSGIDLSSNNLVVSLNFNSDHRLRVFGTGLEAAAGTDHKRFFHMFILHDRFITCSAKEGTVVRY